MYLPNGGLPCALRLAATAARRVAILPVLAGAVQGQQIRCAQLLPTRTTAKERRRAQGQRELPAGGLPAGRYFCGRISHWHAKKQLWQKIQ